MTYQPRPTWGVAVTPSGPTGWHDHLQHEPDSTRLPWATRAGLTAVAVGLSGLLAVTWTDAVPAPTPPPGSVPAATP